MQNLWFIGAVFLAVGIVALAVFAASQIGISSVILLAFAALSIFIMVWIGRMFLTTQGRKSFSDSQK